jgi:ribosomal protein S18 acetylase RimI-like enzyme
MQISLLQSSEVSSSDVESIHALLEQLSNAPATPGYEEVQKVVA